MTDPRPASRNRTIRLSPALDAALITATAEQGATISQVVSDALAAHLDVDAATRPVGRPKLPRPAPTADKRPRGRPRKVAGD